MLLFKKTLDLFQKEASQSSTNINSVDGVAKPTQRRVVLAKEPNTRFGADLCKIGGRVFVLKVDERKSQDLIGDYLPAMRAGLSRFDELLQLEDVCISTFSLPTVYQYLQESRRAVVTIADTPLLRNYQVGSLVAAETLNASLDCKNGDLVFAYNNSSVIPAGEALVQINGELVLGMTLEQVKLVLEYASVKKNGKFSISTFPLDVAAAFLAAYKATSQVNGSQDWKADDLLRRSEKHCKRRTSFSSFRKSASKVISSHSATALPTHSGVEQETLLRARVMLAQ